jgi:hypothetical protein
MAGRSGCGDGLGFQQSRASTNRTTTGGAQHYCAQLFSLAAARDARALAENARTLTVLLRIEARMSGHARAMLAGLEAKVHRGVVWSPADNRLAATLWERWGGPGGGRAA